LHCAEKNPREVQGPSTGRSGPPIAAELDSAPALYQSGAHAAANECRSRVGASALLQVRETTTLKKKKALPFAHKS